MAIHRRSVLRIGKRVATIGDRTLDATCPIYADTGKPYPVAIGSAVLMAVGSARFAVTAAHVLDWTKTHKVYIGGEKLGRLGGRHIESRATSGGDRSADKIDLGVFRLSDDLVGELGDCRYVATSDTSPAHQTDRTPVTGSSYLVSGYPCSKQPTRLLGSEFNAVPIYLATKAQPPAAVVAKGLDPRNSMLFDFDKEATWTTAGRRTAPDPNGVSGGGVWHVPGLVTERPGAETLVAVAIEWHRGNKAILATRIGLCFDAISDHYPELRPLLPTPP